MRLTSVAQLESGHTPSRRIPNYWNGAIPWISLHDSNALDGREIRATKWTITEEGIANSSARLLPKGTVVFSRTATVGKATVMGRPMATSQDFANYVCGPKVHNHYLVHLFRFMAPDWRRVMAGSIHNTIYMPVFEKLEINLPPLEEQRAIASALHDVDRLLRELECLIAKKRDLKQAAMQELLTGKKRLQHFSDPWERRRLGDVAEIVMGQSPSSSSYNLYGRGLPLIQGNADLLDRRAVKRVFTTQVGKRARGGDILMTVRAPVGQVGKTEFEACLGRGVCAIRHRSDFLYHYLVFAENQWERFSRGSTFDSVNSAEIAEFPVVLPASEREQEAIARVLSDLDAEVAEIEVRLQKTLALKNAVMQQLLTGRIRLI